MAAVSWFPVGPFAACTYNLLVQNHARSTGHPWGKAALLLTVQNTHLQPAACLLLLGEPCTSILLQTLCLTRVFHSRMPSKSRSPGAESADAIGAHPAQTVTLPLPPGVSLGIPFAGLPTAASL